MLYTSENNNFGVKFVASKKTGNPRGRPSSYDPSYCDKVIELGKLGKSLEQMSFQLGVHYSTLTRWRDEFPDFCNALTDAHRYSQCWWEEQAQSHIIENKDAPRINAGLWGKIMAARFPATYSDRQKVEISGGMEVDHVNIAMEDFIKTLQKVVDK
jgi:hypothetical protein